jgi:hypothetical protein
VAEKLPIVCWRVEWAETDPRDPGNWVQWHDAEEPPAAWDDEPPTETLALTPHAPAQSALDELRREVEALRADAGRWNTVASMTWRELSAVFENCRNGQGFTAQIDKRAAIDTARASTDEGVGK